MSTQVEERGGEPVDEPVVVTITSLNEAKEAYRSKDLRQALYDEGEVVMADVLVNLHGDEHRARRRLENRLFRRETLVHYEQAMFPSTIDETLAPYVADGHAELVHLGHQLMMNLAALNAGIDRTEGTAEETFRLYGYMMKFIEGATLAHSTRDKAEVSAEVREALAAFDREFLLPSIEHRVALLEAFRSGAVGEEALPRDVLTILLRNEDDLSLPHEVTLRETAFFLLAGAHTSATAFTRTIHNIFTWIEAHPEDAARVHDDRLFVQRCVHETVRLNPSSPVGMRWALADVDLRTGRHIPKGAKVVIDLMTVNRDPEVFGPGADTFDPYREVRSATVGPYGLSFGQGMHACIGQELAAGVLPEQDADREEHLYGLVSVAVQAMFDRGVAPDPDDPPVWDATTRRPYWARYPVRFGA